ncbi:MAG: bifunctional 4-hydroxy-2-oxoglutarate aldolase/2-dehydro-3-deoxy-phosphogluconate aldolase [Pseudomonadota bacterium]
MTNATGAGRAAELERRLARAPVIPVVVIEDAGAALPLARALDAGGLSVVEVTLRTDCALEAIEAIASGLPDVTIGAGTVLNTAQYRDALAAGAGFVVSPGLDDGIVAAALGDGIPVYPGIETAGELQRAWNLGLNAVKFFPAGQAGGRAKLKALSSVFRDMRFVPTGGVSADNLDDYLGVGSVLACGGSWLTPRDAVAAGDYARVTELAAEAVRIADRARA